MARIGVETVVESMSCGLKISRHFVSLSLSRSLVVSLPAVSPEGRQERKKGTLLCYFVAMAPVWGWVHVGSFLHNEAFAARLFFRVSCFFRSKLIMLVSHPRQKSLDNAEGSPTPPSRVADRGQGRGPGPHTPPAP